MSTNKYLPLFSLLLNNKDGFVIEVFKTEVQNIRSALSRLRSNYNKDNKELADAGSGFIPEDIEGKLSVLIDESEEPSSKDKVRIEIKLVKVTPLQFTIVSRKNLHG